MKRKVSAPAPSSSPGEVVEIVDPEEEEEEDDRELRTPRKRETRVPTTSSSSRFKLPDGWIVEEKRRSSDKGGRFDKFYFEPGTRKKFRSLKAVEKYLTQTDGSVTGIAGSHLENASASSLQEENMSLEKVETSTFDSANQPEKVTWVFTGRRGDSWSPFVGESEVPQSERQLWAKTYKLATEGNFL